MKTKRTQKKTNTLGARRHNSLLTRSNQIKALDAATGAWKDKDHPELSQGAAKWVKKVRQETERRFEKVTTRSRQLNDERAIVKMITETKAEEAKNPMSREELLGESKRLSAYGAAQAKKLGIKPSDTNRIIHERRKINKAQSPS